MNESLLRGLRQEIYYAPPSDHGSAGSSRRIGELSLAETQAISDSDRVSEAVEQFMRNLYDSDRYAGHNDRVLRYHAKYSDYTKSESPAEEEQDKNEVMRMAVVLHDFVDHAVLNSETAAVRAGHPKGRARRIKEDALETIKSLFDAVGDRDGLQKAILFAIDAAAWESEARVWRGGTTSRINEIVASGDMKPETGSIVDAAINKTPLLRRINKDRLAEVLKMKPIRLTDLRLGAINQVTLDRNIEGAYLKGLEALDNIKQPPQNNPASTFRDCIEAIYFYSPALALLGYKALAADLRGAALERLIDEEPYNTYAKKQHEISQRHFEAIKKPVLGLLGQEFGGIEAEVEYRLKTEGSIREKLATDTYANLSVVPDGVGFTFIVPDEMAGKETIELARHYMNRLTEAYPNVVAKHPVATEEAFEEVNKANGYQAIHLTFYYYPEDSTDPVPFEIQIQTQTVHEMKLYGSFSDLYYKLGTPFSPDDRAYHKHLAKRMKASREMEPSSTMASVAEMVSKMHEVPSVFNRIFQAIDLGDNGLTLVPAALGEVSQEIADQLVKALGEKEALAVLPAARVGILQFEEALGIFGKSFIKDRHIQDALAMVKSSEASSMRADGKTNVLEGHLLPVALSALMLAIQTGRVWDSELGANEYLSNIVTIAILHDYVETELEKPNNAEAIPLLRQSMLYDIRRRFGSTVMNGVAAMTLPMETKDPYTRREQYRRNIQNNEYARLIKPCDRWQNHITDLIKLATTDQAPKGSDEYRFIMRYFAKTDRHQSADFTAANMPAEYKRIHKVIWQIARHYGYEGET